MNQDRQDAQGLEKSGQLNEVRPEFEALLEQFCLNGLSAGEWKAVATEVAADSLARRRYVETMHLLQSLPYLLSGEPASLGNPEQMPLAPGLGPKSEPSDDKAGVSSKSTGRVQFHLPFWAQAACVAFLIGSLGAWQAAKLISSSGKPATTAAVNLASSSRYSPLGEEHVGRIIALSPVASEQGLVQSMQVGQELRRGEVVQLTAGLMQIEQNAGYKLLIEGPAEFSLMDEDCVFVRNGRLAARGKGEFTLQTPLLTAVCRTAQAVFDVSDDDSAQASVDGGSVAVALTPQEGIPGKQLRVLAPNEGVACSANPDTGERRVQEISSLSHVVRSWSELAQGYDAYEQLILASDPTAYWTLRHVRRNRRVLDLTQHGYDGMPVGNWPAEDAVSAAEEGTYFNGESYIEPDHKPGLDPARGFTIESWAKVAGGPEFQSIFTSRWVLNSMKPDCQCFGFTLYAGDTDCWEFWTGSGVKGEVWHRLVSGVAVDRTRWNHVVATFEPTEVRDEQQLVVGRARLVLNGKVIAEAKQQLSLQDFEWPARIGAAEFVPRYLTSWMFQGRLCDVALYNRPLEIEVINGHFEAGQTRRLNKVTYRVGRPELSSPAVEDRSKS